MVELVKSRWNQETSKLVHHLYLCSPLASPAKGKTKMNSCMFIFRFFQEGLKTINHFQSFIDKLVNQLEEIKRNQHAERQELVKLRDALKNSMSSYKEVSIVSVPT